MLSHLFIILSSAAFVIAVIASIGPQSLNIISHAIRRNHEIAVATTCIIADCILIIIGGIGLTLSSKTIIYIINGFGICFMAIYIAIRSYNLLKNKGYKHSLNDQILTKKQAILKALALTWLNPLVFIDTIVIIGGTAMQYAKTQRLSFMIGAIIGDVLWLYGLMTLAKIFSYKLNRPRIWIILDVMTITIMTVILYKTFLFLFFKAI